MDSQSIKLAGKTCVNPFREAQARTFGDEKLVGEFLPTSLYLSLLNEQNEILLGSRGSGKTVLLRMLSYTCFSRINDRLVHESAAAFPFIGVYIPLHLEFMASIAEEDDDGRGSREFFQFAFNCAAAKAFLGEVRALLNQKVIDVEERLKQEFMLRSVLCDLWQLPSAPGLTTIEDVGDAIQKLYFHQNPWKDGTLSHPPLFAKSVFSPLLSAIPRCCRILNIDCAQTHWLACVDEAEFLKPEYIKCFNSFMRSEHRPIVLKIATLPYKYATMETCVPGERIEAGGNDCNFRYIDLPWDSQDFKRLADHLTTKRLCRTGLFPTSVTLEEFIGALGKDDPRDYFREEVGAEEATDSSILDQILREVSPQRRARFERIRLDPARVESEYFNKFSPVLYLRRLRREAEKGNRKVGLFAGPDMTRRVSDGNPRRFIQLMHDLFERARAGPLAWKTQHEVIFDFARRECERAAALPVYGILLHGILKAVGRQMEQRVHGKEHMIEIGYNFEVGGALLSNVVIRNALELGIGYSFLFVDPTTITGSLRDTTSFRLAHVVAVKHWLPMRSGSPVTLQARQNKELLQNHLLSRAPATLKERDTALGSLQLDFLENIPSDVSNDI